MSDGTTSTTNGSSTVLVLIYNQDNELIKHYHFGGSSNSANSKVYGVAKNPQGGFAISGCYWGGAAYIGNHRFSSYGVSGSCSHGFLVSFNSTFDLDFAKEMTADGSSIAYWNTWASLAIDDNETSSCQVHTSDVIRTNVCTFLTQITLEMLRKLQQSLTIVEQILEQTRDMYTWQK